MTGITTNLLGQTSNRLADDLGEAGGPDDFKFIDNAKEEDSDKIERAYRLSTKPLIVLPILKHAKYINELAKLFRSNRVHNFLSSETVLIIDDEADQASLNNYGYHNSKNDEEKQSAIYAAILRLRAALPGNSYIQYTATPQANLLITTMDLLSPRSHTLLTPGEGYVGGKKFFGMDEGGILYNGKMAVEIPSKEVFHRKKNDLNEMPSSLREAMMMHVWAVVLVIRWFKRKNIQQLSMMVHPTEIIDGNKKFEKWIRHEINNWSTSLSKPEGHEDRQYLLKQFKDLLPQALKFYDTDNKPSFDDVSGYLSDIINDCEIYRVTGDNDKETSQIDWNQHRMNILIGAQKLNRGFTVEKLATTYMPRHATGTSNADTIEQRCRFFGYKMSYIESCRAYLPQETIQDYKDYVRHEEELRTLLAQCNTLKEYEHSVMLSPRLRPTRRNVLSKRVVVSRLSGWVKFGKMSGKKMVEENKNLVGQFVLQHLPDAHEFNIDVYNSNDYKEGEMRRHVMKMMEMGDIITLLTDFTTANLSDSITKSMLLRYFQYLEMENNRKIMVIFMSKAAKRERQVYKLQDDEWRVEMFQGPSRQGDSSHYAGDTNIFDKDFITIQVHHLQMDKLPVGYAQNTETYSLAVHIPESLATKYTSNGE